jgi:cytoskeletal protein CcmA (bactofilin family)
MPDDQQPPQQDTSLEVTTPPDGADVPEESASLDAPTTDLNPTNPVENQVPIETETPNNDNQPVDPKPQKTPLLFRLKLLRKQFNIYVVIFVVLLLISAIGIYTFNALNSTKSATPNGGASSDKLTNEALSQLGNSDVKIGDPKQVLGIESNTIFAGKVLVRDSLEVAGSLKLGGSLSLSGLNVAGTSTFDQIQTNSIAISQNAAVQGQLTVQRTLNVAGGGSFGGALSAPQITVDNLQLNGDLRLSHHIDPTGSTPSKSDGSALGSGGTSSVSGTDTAGTVVINTGGSPPAGCFITVNFTQHFNATPHISLTPANSAASSLNYYVNRTSANFSVCSSSAPAASQNYMFDFIAID